MPANVVVGKVQLNPGTDTWNMPKSVSQSALTRRINRSLAHDGERLSKGRDGKFHHLSDSNVCLDHGDGIDLEDFARQCGVLAESEQLAN
jgi:hypothetical protein